MVWNILAIGRTDETLPPHDDIRWSHDPRQPADAIAIFDANDIPHGLSPLLPLAVFPGAGFDGPMALVPDFAAAQAAPEQLDAMLAAFTPVRERLAELEGLDSPYDRTELAILRLTYSRAQPLQALRSPVTPSTLLYPLLQGRPGLDAAELRPALETLANHDLLERRFGARVLCCPSCHGGRISAYEACTACGSANLAEEPIVHHYRCGFQDGESRFLQGIDLICPKCQQELRHFGVDYGRPGVMQRCRACQQVMSEPQPRFHCLDCQTVSRGDQALPVDWYDYSLTERGIAVARTGVLPQTEAGPAGIFPRTFALKDFTMLVRSQLLVAQRYNRPLTIGRIGIGNLTALRQHAGVEAGGAAIRLFSQILVESLRDTDFVAAPRDDLLLVAMPETDPEQAGTVFERIRTAADRLLALPVALDFDAVPAEQAGLLLDELTAVA